MSVAANIMPNRVLFDGMEASGMYRYVQTGRREGYEEGNNAQRWTNRSTARQVLLDTTMKATSCKLQLIICTANQEMPRSSGTSRFIFKAPISVYKDNSMQSILTRVHFNITHLTFEVILPHNAFQARFCMHFLFDLCVLHIPRIIIYFNSFIVGFAVQIVKTKIPSTT